MLHCSWEKGGPWSPICLHLTDPGELWTATTELTKEASTQLYQCPHNAHTLPTPDCTKAFQSMSDPTKPASWKIAQQRLAKHWSALSSCPCLFDVYRSDQANMMATSGPREVRVRRSGRLRRWPLENRPNRERAAYFRPSQSLPWIPPARQLQRTMRWRSMRLRIASWNT